MYYTIMPPDILFMDIDKPRKFFEIQKNNVIFKLEEINEDEYMIFDIFSLNVSDYMNSSIFPGTIIKKKDLINL
ncbi:MAG: YlzJ-like family protein [Thermoanaerobacteraceae bacterium]|nr:YlzJ-like family protein [Thermoanaerobacteraceae bacterium]